MADQAPVVYTLHGDDEFAIAQFISRMEARLGGSAEAALNFTRLDGRTYNLDDLPSLTGAMPFMAKRRLVVLSHPQARLNSPTAQANFIEQLERIPPTTALVLVEDHLLTTERDRRNGKLHWLERWSVEAGKRAYIRSFVKPRGAQLSRWIMDQSQNAGGRFSPQAADLLASLIGDDTRLAGQEIHKLLAYVNYQREVEVEDVEKLTADSGGVDIFAMVDAMGQRDGQRSMGLLRRLLEERDAGSIFGMVIRQFRLLLLAKEILEQGGEEREIASQLRIPPFVARKLIPQARQFTILDLEAVYSRLLDLDEAVKTGRMPGELALETLVASLSYD